MCNVAQAIEDRGIEKGKLQAICNLMKNMKLSAKQAMEALSVPESEYAKYEELLKQSAPKA